MITVLVPCYNEAASLAAMLGELPRSLLGHPVRVLLADDGSTDGSAALAREWGAEVLGLPHAGLARTFAAGMQAAHPDSACVVVMDADGQYDPAFLTALVRPVLSGEADLVLGERADHRRTLTPVKRALHHLGSAAVRGVLRLEVNDPISGYRAYSPRAAQMLQVQTGYTYTLETLAQVRPLDLRLTSLALPARPTARPSRLVKGALRYSLRQAWTLLWAAYVYRQSASPRRAISAVRRSGG